MRVLQINAVERVSSTGRTVTEFDAFLKDRGVESFIACSVPAADSDSFQIGTPTEKKLHGLLSRMTGKQGWFSHKGTKELLGFMDEIKPDIVMLRVLHGNFINFPMLMDYLAKKNIATVLILHDCWFFTGKCCHYSQTGCDRFQTGCGNCPRIKQDNPSWLFDRTSYLWRAKKQMFDKIDRLGVVGVSEWIANEGAKSPLFANAREITGIYNGIDFAKFHYDAQGAADLREKYGLQEKKVLLAVASKWSAHKGLSDLTALAAKMPADWQLVCVGALPQDYTVPEAMLHIAATDSVEELASWYSAADVFLNLSKEETFGKVSAEALSCGTPVVCYNTTANPEIVGDGCGAVCSGADVQAYFDCVQTVLASGRDSYADACTAFAHAQFDKEKNYEKLLEFLRRLAKNR